MMISAPSSPVVAPAAAAASPSIPAASPSGITQAPQPGAAPAPSAYIEDDAPDYDEIGTHE